MSHINVRKHCQCKYAVYQSIKNLVDPSEPWAHPHITMSGGPSSNVSCFYLALFAKAKSIISGNSQSVNTPASCLGTQLQSATSGPPQGLRRWHLLDLDFWPWIRGGSMGSGVLLEPSALRTYFKRTSGVTHLKPPLPPEQGHLPENSKTHEGSLLSLELALVYKNAI